HLLHLSSCVCYPPLATSDIYTLSLHDALPILNLHRRPIPFLHSIIHRVSLAVGYSIICTMPGKNQKIQLKLAVVMISISGTPIMTIQKQKWSQNASRIKILHLSLYKMIMALVM